MFVGRRQAQFVAVFATLLAACAGSDPVTAPAPTTVPTSGVSVSVDESVDPIATTTQTSTTVESPTTTAVDTSTTTDAPADPTIEPVPDASLALVAEVDRNVSLSSLLVADNDGVLLGTRLDPEVFGCEATPISYFVTVGADGAVSPTSTTDESFQYAGYVTPSPSRRQLLEVNSCEGFLGGVTLYDIDSALQITNPVEIDLRDAVSGDASWNVDGFITLVLNNQPGFYVEPVEEGEEPPAPQIDEYLVNPRSGDSTQSGSLTEFVYGAVRLGDGRTVHVEFGAGGGIVLTGRSGETQSFPGTGFSISPDATRMAVWNQVFEEIEGPMISLVDLVSGNVTKVAEGAGYAVSWQDDSSRMAYSVREETVVVELATGESLEVGSVEAVDCGADDFVEWGRVPLAFAPNGDLYVGDPVCGRSSEDVPTIEYRVRQLTLN